MLAGCGGNQESPSLTVSKTKLSPGELTAYTVRAANIHHMKFKYSPRRLEMIPGKFSPEPEMKWLGDPPGYTWDGKVDIEGEFWIFPEKDTPPGTYDVAVELYHNGDENPTRLSTTLTVEKPSHQNP